MPIPARTRTQLMALAAAGVLFAAYPITRPYSDETTLDGARAMSSDLWIASHTFAMLAFILLAAGLPSLRAITVDRRAGADVSLLAWVGAGLVLPYYGAEVFGLHAIAAEAVASSDRDLLRLTDTVRYQPVAIAFFGVGLVLLAVVGARTARQLWHASSGLRWGGLLLGAGLVAYLPQFFLPAPLRIAHGVLLGLGCVVLAVVGWRRGAQPDPQPRLTASVPTER